MKRNRVQQADWKRQVYMVGAAAGTLFGLISAYFFTRSAEESEEEPGPPKPVQTRDLMALGIAAVAILRQIAELGRTEPKK